MPVWGLLWDIMASFRVGKATKIMQCSVPSAVDPSQWISKVPESILKPRRRLGTGRKSSGAAGGAGKWRMDGAEWRDKVRAWLTWWWCGIPLALPGRNEERCEMGWEVVLSRQDTGKRLQQRSSQPGSVSLHAWLSAWSVITKTVW